MRAAAVMGAAQLNPHTAMLKNMSSSTSPLPGRLLIDGHNDLPWALRQNYDYSIAAGKVGAGNTELHTDIPALRRGEVGGQFWSVYVSTELAGAAAVAATLEQIDCVHRLVETFPEDFALAASAAEVREAAAAGKIASLMGMEGGHCIDGSLAVLRQMRRAGVSYMTLTHNDNTPWAASATGEPVDYGLTGFGREVVAEMNRVGMLVDLSHVHQRTMHEALDVSTAPVIFSHSSCRAVHDHPRNVPDDVLVRLRQNGGVLMVTFVPSFISATPDSAGIEDVVAHLEHAREVVGADHIGLGGDFDGIPRGPQGLGRVSDYPALLDRLSERGWTEAEITQLTSGNILRVLELASA